MSEPRQSGRKRKVNSLLFGNGMIPLEDEHRSRRKNPSKNDTDNVAENLVTVGTSEATSSNNSAQPRKKAASKNAQPRPAQLKTQNEAAVDSVVNVISLFWVGNNRFTNIFVLIHGHLRQRKDMRKQLFL